MSGRYRRPELHLGLAINELRHAQRLARRGDCDGAMRSLLRGTIPIGWAGAFSSQAELPRELRDRFRTALSLRDEVAGVVLSCARRR